MSGWRREKLALFLDLGCLAAQVAQVVQLGAPDFTAGHDLDLVDVGAVYREGAFHADAEGDFPDGEGFPNTATLAADDNALEDLDTRLGAFDHFDVHVEGVARVECGNIVAQ